MKKYSKLPKVYRNLGRKLWDFLHLDNEPEFFYLGELVQPVIPVNEILKELDGWEASVSVTGSGVFRKLLEVPENYRYWLHSLMVRVNTGTWTFDRLNWVDDTETKFIRFFTQANCTIYDEIMPHPIPLEEGWSIRAYIDTHAVNGTADVDGLIMKEKLQR